MTAPAPARVRVTTPDGGTVTVTPGSDGAGLEVQLPDGRGVLAWLGSDRAGTVGRALLAAAAAAAVTTGCAATTAPSAPASVVVDAASDVCWQGSVGGGAELRSVDGCGPTSLEITGSPVVAAVQKTGESAAVLRVAVVRDGVVLAEQQTSSPFGAVSVTGE